MLIFQAIGFVFACLFAALFVSATVSEAMRVADEKRAKNSSDNDDFRWM